jgi:protein O-GlcNAc transferase
VSADLFAHPVGRFLLPVLEHLDRAAFEVACYPTTPRRDRVTELLAARADRWRPLVTDTDRAAEILRDEAIDILVDLGGHTSGDVLEIFARRPAPAQVSWLGYPNTTGLARIGWRLTDAIADPPGDADRLSSERLIRLPDGFHCYVPTADATPPNALPAGSGETDGTITFGSLNALAKLSDATIAAWACVLAATPRSRLLIRRSGLAAAAAREPLLARFAAHGIAADRLALVAGGAGGSIEAYHAIDIALDSFPYNGTTTTCDALWMGVPVVTWRGTRHAARVGASLLHRLGLDALVGESVDDFVAIATRLAGDRQALAGLRGSLRGRMAASPLCDAPGFGRAMGEAFSRMWREVAP